MKWSAVLAVCAAPLAFAGYMDVDLVRREGDKSDKSSKQTVKSNGNSITIVSTEIIIIWVNNGGGATTSTLNTQSAASATSGGAVAAAAATHQVTVGGAGGLVYTPDTIEAAVGDMVIFTFMSQNHTVTQSAFAEPCVKLEGGISSGFMPNANNSIVPAPQMAMQVSVATPIWFYCAQKGHCGKGMTFSINPTANKTQAMFQAMAVAQNGTGTVAGIVGGSSSTTAAAAAATSSAGSIVAGTGTVTDGQCSCSCLCAVEAFPNAVQGIGAFGGMTGALPASLMEKRRR